MRQLEDELGFQVFLRRGKSLDSITASGSQVIARARNISTDRPTFAPGSNLRRDGDGELIITTTHTQARFVLPGAVSLMSSAARNSRFGLSRGDTELIELLGRGSADMAIVSTANKTAHGRLGHSLFSWDRKILVPRAHALAELGRAPRIDELAAWPLVSYESSLAADSSLRKAFVAAGCELNLAVTARDADLIKVYVRAGLGVGVLAESALLESDSKDLCVLSAEGLLPTCTTWVVLQADRVQRDYALDLIAALAPRVDRRDLVRVVQGAASPAWSTPPHWRDLSVQHANAA